MCGGESQLCGRESTEGGWRGMAADHGDEEEEEAGQVARLVLPDHREQ